MRVEWVNPFIRAANHVLVEVAQLKRPQTGAFRVEHGPFTTDDATVILGVDGKLAGNVVLSMSQQSAEMIVERMAGQRLQLDDRLAESALGELANMVAGYALGFLESAGFTCSMTPPVMLRGSGTVVTLTPSKRLVVPLQFPEADIEIVVCLHES